MPKLLLSCSKKLPKNSSQCLVCKCPAWQANALPRISPPGQSCLALSGSTLILPWRLPVSVRQVYSDRWKALKCYSEIAGQGPESLLGQCWQTLQPGQWSFMTVLQSGQASLQVRGSEPELPTCQPEPDRQGKLRVQIVQADCVCSMPTRNATNVFHQLTREFFQRVHFKPYWGWHSLHLDQRNCDLTSTTCSCCSADQKFGFRCWTQVTQGLAIEALFIDWCYKHCTNICLQGREKHGFKTDESLMIVKNGYLNYCWAIRPQQCGPKIM